MQFLFLTQQPQLQGQIIIFLPVSLRSKVMFRRLQSNSELLYGLSHILLWALECSFDVSLYIDVNDMLENINHETIESTISS